MPPISKPPTLASTSSPSFGSGLLTSSACSMTPTLCRSCFASMPVPRPVTASGVQPVRAAAMAALGVVLPMPMSPVPKMSVDRPVAARAPCRPRCSGWRRRGSSPGRARCSACPVRCAWRGSSRSAPAPLRSPAAPMSTTTTRAPTTRASALIPAPPATKLCTICGVTSCGYLLTPSATTPWSPAIVTMVLRATGGFMERVMPARSSARSISRPSAQCGMVSCSSRAWAFARHAASCSRMPLSLSSRTFATSVSFLQMDGQTADDQDDFVRAGGHDGDCSGR